MKYYVSSAARGIYTCEYAGGRFTILDDNENVKAALWLNGGYACVHDPEGGYVVNVKTLEKCETNGIEPCHIEISPDGRFLYVANYQTGSIAVIRADTLEFVQLVTHTGSGTAHVHFCKFNPRDGLMYVCDLGLDTIFIYRQDPDSGYITEADRLHVPQGSGPRHLVFKGDFIYCGCELKSTVNVFRGGKLIQTISSLPADFAGESYAGGVRLDGDRVYVANRGHNSITELAIGEDGLLALNSVIPCGGNWPRDFIITPDGILVANQKSGNLTFAGENKPSIDIPAAVCIIDA